MHNTTQKMNTEKKAAALIELSVSLFFNFIMFVLLRENSWQSFMSDVWKMLIQKNARRITKWVGAPVYIYFNFFLLRSVLKEFFFLVLSRLIKSLVPEVLNRRMKRFTF